MKATTSTKQANSKFKFMQYETGKKLFVIIIYIYF